jgi:hypothetical protein
MRTEKEIVERIRNSKSLFGFDQGVLLSYLPFQTAKEFLKPEVTDAQWSGYPLPPEKAREELVEYLDFAIGKCADHRGLSAVRSVEKLAAWLWLLQDDELLAFANDDSNYPQYGAPIVKAIADKYAPGLEQPSGFLRMASGERCQPGCEEGCSR